MIDILDDLFHSCALVAWFEIWRETSRWPPDSELTRQRAYELYEARKEAARITPRRANRPD
jgi:hypothetical protein